MIFDVEYIIEDKQIMKTIKEEEYANTLNKYKENISKADSYIFHDLKTVAYCFKVIDGDTIKCLIQFNDIYLKVIVRLDGVDTAEKKSTKETERKLAEKASLFTKRLLEDRLVELEFLSTDKYGRHLCNVYQINVSGSIRGASVSQQLVDNKLANTYSGGKKQDFEHITQSHFE